MSLLKSKPDVLQRRASALVILGLLLVLPTAGCGSKKVVTTAPAPGSDPAGVARGVPVKLTPEQEATKQRAIQQGPAIEAALKRGQGQ